MASSGNLTDKGMRRRTPRRQRQRSRKQIEADEQHVLEPIETTDSSHQPDVLAETHLPVVARQTAAQNIAQRQGNGQLLAIVQRKRKPKVFITTPVDKAAKKLKNGAVQMIVNGVMVKILPDQVSTDKSMTGQAETKGDLDWKPPAFDYEGDTVTKIKGNAPVVCLTVQTTYGPDATAQDPSAYGRGTTEADKKAGKTTLGFHEGQHGLQYIQYIKEHPLPQFLGKIEMKVAQYQAAMDAYQKAMTAYAVTMGKQNKAQTDCVGAKASFCIKE